MIQELILPTAVITTIWLLFKWFTSSAHRRVLAIDTEMVGAGSLSMLAKVSIVDRRGYVIYDEYVHPLLPVTDYRTPWSGIREGDLFGAKSFYEVRREVLSLLRDCILVGHDLPFDLKVLDMTHPDRDIRDTARYRQFRYNFPHKPSLKYLAREFLGRYIQLGEHSSVEDARAAMDLYLLVEDQWEKEIPAEPRNLKLKLDGSIDLPFMHSQSEEQTNVQSNDDQADTTEQNEPMQDRNSDTINENEEVKVGDYAEDQADSSIRVGSAEKTASDRDESNLAKALLRNGINETRDNPETQLHNVTSPASLTQKATKFKRHKVQDDERIRKFTAHVYQQALKAFEAMKKKTDPYTKKKIDSLADTYKEKFTDFVKRTRETDIKTKQGTQNVILHTIDTSNLIMERISNFLRTDMHGSGSSALRQGGASKLQKEMDTVKALEFEHACKMFKICRSANGFRNELQNILSTLLVLPDNKLLQANDAATEVLKNSDLSAFTFSNPILNRIKKAIKTLEKADAAALRTNLQVLFSVLSKSHLPLVLHKGNTFEKHAVKRTVSFHNLLDAIDEALPPTEANRKEWEAIANHLRRWKDGGLTDVQGTFQSLFNNVNRGVKKYGERSEKIRELVEDIAEQ